MHLMLNALNLKGSNMNTAVISALITFYAGMFNVERTDLSCSLKLASNYQVTAIVPSHYYGIGMIDEKTTKAWKIDKQKLVTNGYYSIYWSAYYLDFIKQSYKENDFTTWQCGFRSKYTTRNAYCVRYMEQFRQCLNDTKGIL